MSRASTAARNRKRTAPSPKVRLNLIEQPRAIARRLHLGSVRGMAEWLNGCALAAHGSAGVFVDAVNRKHGKAWGRTCERRALVGALHRMGFKASRHELVAVD